MPAIADHRVNATALRRHRLAAGLSQSALADRAGMSKAYLSRLEAGHRTSVSARIVRGLADALSCEQAELVAAEVAA